jgi:hypothetical protein
MNSSFNEFLNIIGKRIELKGYTGWAAGLDTKSKVVFILLLLFIYLLILSKLGGDSGEYSYTNVWNENILAYHVSTLIPSRPGDKQHIQRKRHIGNGI